MKNLKVIHRIIQFALSFLLANLDNDIVAALLYRENATDEDVKSVEEVLDHLIKVSNNIPLFNCHKI